MVTISDVAARAGVSIKSVSRVLNHEDHVRPVLRDRVRAAASELGYRPSLAARQLAGNRSYLIAMLIADAMNSYFSRMVVEAAAECRAHSYHLVSETVGDFEGTAEIARRITETLRPDGIILPPPLSSDAEAIAAIEKSGTPLVKLATDIGGYGLSMPVDERPISRRLVEHLIDQGHRRISMIAPPPDHPAAQRRVVGYREAIEAAGIAFDPTLVIRGGFDFASGARATATLLGRPNPPTAIFASNDGQALGAMAVAYKFGLAIPRDLAIAGFDDSPGSRMVYPALTTVQQPVAALARNAVRSLLGKADLQEPEYTLVIRGSTTGINDLILTASDA